MFNICNHDFTFLFGFTAFFTPSQDPNSAYSKATWGVARSESLNKVDRKWLAMGNLIGAIPVFGGIPVGFARIFVGIRRFQGDTYEGSALIGRGLVEIAGGGPFLFLLDIFFTLGRLLPRAPEADPAENA